MLSIYIYIFFNYHKITRYEFSFWVGQLWERFFWMDVGPKCCLLHSNLYMCGANNVYWGTNILVQMASGRHKNSYASHCKEVEMPLLHKITYGGCKG